MPIASYRHNMKTTSGKPVFLTRTPLPKTRKFLGRTFIDGQAHTTNADLAKRFLEEFQYEVVLPKGYRGPFDIAEGYKVEVGVEYREEGEVILGDDDESLIPDDD